MVGKNEQELRDFFENANVAIHWVDADGIIKRVNQAELDMLGYSREEYVGSHIADFHADQEVIEDILTRLKNREELSEYEARLQCKDGSIKYVLINSSVYEKDGDFIHTRCITRDITKQKRTEEALREKEGQLASQVADMKRLYELSLRLQQQDDVSDTMHEVMMASAELMNADKASVQLYDEESDVIRLVSTLGFDSKFEEQFDVIDAEGITTCAAVLKEREQILVEDFENTDEFPEFGKISSSHGMRAVLSTPLFGSDDQFLGVFSMYWKNPHRPAEDKLQLLDLYAQQAARQIERRRAEQVLRRSEEKYRTLFELMDEGFCIIKMIFDEHDKPVNFRYLETNPAYHHHSGLQDQEVEGKTAKEVLPNVGEEMLKRNANVALTGKPFHAETYVEEIDRWLDLSSFRIGKSHERKVAVLFNNVTERKQAQEEREQLLREIKTERERLSDIFHHAPSFMCTLRGPDHVFERANELYRKLVGEDREIIGKPVREVFPEIEGQGFFEMLDQVYETGEPFIRTDIPVKLNRDPDSEGLETRYLDLVYQPLRNADGSVNGIFAQGVDLTERHHAKEKLKAINETLEERVEKRTRELQSYQQQLRSLASKLNKTEEQERQRLASELHDKLGQMLTVAKMQVDGLQHNNVPDQISAELEELNQVVDDALKYNQNLMSELKPPPVLDKEDITEVLLWTAKNMQKELDISIEDDGKSKPVDKELRSVLHQSVRELLRNVVKHADVDEARMSISSDNDQVKIIIEDKGKGFDMNKNRPSPTEGGRFGLFNIQERMDWHGGMFEIHSEPGKGTKAVLYAPMKEINNLEEVDQDYKETPPPSDKIVEQGNVDHKIKVLLVDDHDMVRRGLRQMIEKQDDLTIVAEASNGREAVELAHKNTPDIIVMDVNMPVMDGIAATKKIKAEMPNVRIIGLSLHDSPEVIEDMRSAGASSYLTKNEAFETLCVTIWEEASASKE